MAKMRVTFMLASLKGAVKHFFLLTDKQHIQNRAK